MAATAITAEKKQSAVLCKTMRRHYRRRERPARAHRGTPAQRKPPPVLVAGRGGGRGPSAPPAHNKAPPRSGLRVGSADLRGGGRLNKNECAAPSGFDAA